MKPADKVARGILLDAIRLGNDEALLTACIKVSRREGAEDMRERAAHEADEDLWATRELSRIIRALPLEEE